MFGNGHISMPSVRWDTQERMAAIRLRHLRPPRVAVVEIGSLNAGDVLEYLHGTRCIRWRGATEILSYLRIDRHRTILGPFSSSD